MTRMKLALSSLAALALVGMSGTAALAGNDETRLRAQLTAATEAGDISGQADFRDRDGRRQFSAEIEGFAAGEVHDVMVAGVVVGTLTVGVDGIGDLNLDSNFEAGVDDPATRIPANFPALDGGELVQVGPLQGSLQPK